MKQQIQKLLEFSLFSLTLLVTLSAPAITQTKTGWQKTVAYSFINDAATKSNQIFIFENSLDNASVNIALKDIISKKTEANSEEIIQGFTAFDYEVKRFGPFVSFKKQYNQGKYDVPSVSLIEGLRCIRNVKNICSSYLPQSSFDTNDKETKKRLIELFEDSNATELPINEGNKKDHITEQAVLPVYRLSEGNRSVALELGLSFYTGHMAEPVKYAEQQFLVFTKGHPKFCFMERAGLDTFGYTTAGDNLPASRRFHAPLSHPGIIVFDHGSYGVMRMIDSKGKSIKFPDPTAPTPATLRFVNDLFSSTSLASATKELNISSKITINDALEDKQIILFGNRTMPFTVADTENFGEAIAFLYDLDFAPTDKETGTLRLRKIRPARNITDLSKAIRDALPSPVARALRGYINAASKKTPKEKIRDQSDEDILHEESIRKAIVEYRIRAVRLLRAKIEPLIAKSGNSMVSASDLGPAERNLMAFILLTATLPAITEVTLKPIPEYLTDLNHMILIKRVTEKDGESAISIFVGVTKPDGSPSGGPGFGFPATEIK